MTGHHDGAMVDLINVVRGRRQGQGQTMSEKTSAAWKNRPVRAAVLDGMFSAISMNCLTEAIGLGLPGNGTIPAVERPIPAKQAGWPS